MSPTNPRLSNRPNAKLPRKRTSSSSARHLRVFSATSLRAVAMKARTPLRGKPPTLRTLREPPGAKKGSPCATPYSTTGRRAAPYPLGRTDQRQRIHPSTAPSQRRNFVLRICTTIMLQRLVPPYLPMRGQVTTTTAQPIAPPMGRRLSVPQPPAPKIG